MKYFVFILSMLLATSGAAKASQIFTYSYAMMDNNKCPNDNYLMGIDDLGQVVGYADCGGTKAFTAEQPGYAYWKNISYPGSTASWIFSIDNTYNKAGQYLAGTMQMQGYIRGKGAVYTSFPYPVQGVGHIHCGPTGGHHCHGHQHESDLFAVGGTETTGWKLDVNTGAYTTIMVPGSVRTIATGFNEQGDICGNWNGGIFLLSLNNPKYYTFQYPNSLGTVAYHLNWQKQIVGFYLDKNMRTHGYILTYPDSKNPYWQTIDVPAAWKAVATVVTGNNDHGDIVGYWVGVGGDVHGFMGKRNKGVSN